MHRNYAIINSIINFYLLYFDSQLYFQFHKPNQKSIINVNHIVHFLEIITKYLLIGTYFPIWYYSNIRFYYLQIVLKYHRELFFTIRFTIRFMLNWFLFQFLFLKLQKFRLLFFSFIFLHLFINFIYSHDGHFAKDINCIYILYVLCGWVFYFIMHYMFF